MGNIHAYGEAFNIMGDDIDLESDIQSIADALSVPFNPSYVPSDLFGRAGEKYGYVYTGLLLWDKANSALFDTSKIKMVVLEMSTEILFHEGIRDSLYYLLSTDGWRQIWSFLWKDKRSDECGWEDSEWSLVTDLSW